MNSALLVIAICSVAFGLVMALLALRLWREERLRSDVRVALLAEMSREPDARSTPVAAELFHDASSTAAWPRRIAIAGGLFAAAALVIVLVSGTGSSTAPPAPPVATAQQPLELVSLSHSQETGALIVSGLVQNPEGARTQSRVVATAVLLDARGAPVGDGSSPLDIARLGPGDESPFVIRIPVQRPVSRYRVSFRSSDDAPLPHVDRRDPAVARKEAP